MTASCIYSGQVWHHRIRDCNHAFRYSIFLAYFDLAELPDVLDRYWFWSARRFAPVRFCRSDHTGDPAHSLDQSIRDLVSSRLGIRPQGPVRLLTGLRHFGFLMNPVSFYYCFDQHENLMAVVAEVTNTPWKEQFCYVLDARPQFRHTEGKTSVLRTCCAKDFHVSPFLPMSVDYHWKLTVPGESLSLTIDVRERQTTAFSAGLNLKRRPINSRNLASCMISAPLMPCKVAAGIYWQALRLWLRKAPFFPHPRKKRTGRSETAVSESLCSAENSHPVPKGTASTKSRPSV